MTANTIKPSDPAISSRQQARRLAGTLGRWALALLFSSIVVGLIATDSLTVPEPDPSLSELGFILRSNLTLLFALGACAVLQRFARQEVEDGSKPWVRWICDSVVIVFISLNVAAVGFAIGQLGGEGLARILPHAWLEVPAFALGVWGYCLARFDAIDRAGAVRIFGLAVACLLLAAPIEVFISGGIR